MPTDPRRLLEDLALLGSLEPEAAVEQLLGRIERETEADRNDGVREAQAREAAVEDQVSIAKADRFLVLGDACFQAGEFETAAEHYAVAARSYPAGHTLAQNGLSGRGYANFRLAVALREAGAPGLALDYFELLAGNPHALGEDLDEVRVFAEEFDAEYRRACEGAIAATAGLDDPAVRAISERAMTLLGQLREDGPGSLRAALVRLVEREDRARAVISEGRVVIEKLKLAVEARNRADQDAGVSILSASVLSYLLLIPACWIGMKSDYKFDAGSILLLAVGLPAVVALVTRSVKYSPGSEFAKADAEVQRVNAELNEAKQRLDAVGRGEDESGCGGRV